MTAPDDALRRFATPSEIESELATQLALLEAMFDDPELAQLRRSGVAHPAVQRYDHLRRGLATPADEDTERAQVQDLARGLLDRFTWVRDAGARPFWSNAVPDPAQAVQVQRRITDPEQFDDTMTELFVWGALRNVGVEADLQEREGEPDIHLPGRSPLQWIEAKRIHLGTAPGRARDVLAKASRQIKRVSPDNPGVAFVFIETSGEAAVFDDAVPSEVRAYTDEVARTLGSRDDKHVGHVVVAWDDFMVLGKYPNRVLYAIRRRSLLLSHRNAVAASSPPEWARAFDFTSVVWVRPIHPAPERPQALTTGDVIATPLFQDRNNWAGGIRVAHARRVLAAPDGSVEIEVPGGGLRIALATKRLDATHVPQVVLLISTRRADEPLNLADGFRLTGSESELSTWASDPRRAFEDLLRRFGVPVSVAGGSPQLFQPHVRGTEPMSLVPYSASDTATCAFIRVNETGWEASWVYAVDDTRYRASVL